VFVVDVPLILEREWNGPEEILYDFRKLILGRAQHRVMVFCRWDAHKVEQTFEVLKNHVKHFTRTRITGETS
jgi:hypothetical protein